jgi:PAS domain S-box-containing protein
LSVRLIVWQHPAVSRAGAADVPSRPRCPYARGGIHSGAMLECPGFAAIEVVITDGPGRGILAGRSCASLAPSATARGQRPACHHPAAAILTEARLRVVVGGQVDWPAAHACDAAVVITDAAGTITYWNAGAETLYGWGRAEALGRPVTDLMVAPEDARQAGEILEAVAAGRPWAGRFRVPRRDGTTVLVQVVDSPLIDAGGVLHGIVGVSTLSSGSPVELRGRPDMTRGHAGDAMVSDRPHCERMPVTDRSMVA